LSDIEVEHEEQDGKLYYVKYPFKDGSGFLMIATTRPETILGDTAVAVNPEDSIDIQGIRENTHTPFGR
jgi:valyl-tRNA synthetase